MFKPTIRMVIASAAIAGAAAVVGCEVHVYGPPPPPPPVATVTVGPVVSDPGVTVVDVLPPPDQRVYIYDPGYPPGCYVYGGFVYYNGYRYPRDVFVHRVVEVNVREHRYMDVHDNRARGENMRQQQRIQYNRYGGHYKDHPEERH